MKHMVAFLRDVTNYQVPILFKLGPSRPYADVAACIEAGADAISIDGHGGRHGLLAGHRHPGRGHPHHRLPAARRAGAEGLRRAPQSQADRPGRHPQRAGRLTSAMAMGADAVGFGCAAEIALGCRVCYACHKGNCPYGITSQKPEFRARLDPVEGGQRLANFIHATAEEVKILTMLSGHSCIAELSTEDLRAMDMNTAALTGLKLAGYERPLPMWEKAAVPTAIRRPPWRPYR